MKLYAHINGTTYEFDVEADGEAIRVGGHRVVLDGEPGSVRTAFLDDRRIEFGWARRNGAYEIVIDGIEVHVEVRDALAERAAEFAHAHASPGGEVPVRAPIPGMVRRVLVAEGQPVAKDQPVLTLDAMKLENELPAPRAGVVRSVRVQPGTAVDKGEVLVVIA